MFRYITLYIMIMFFYIQAADASIHSINNGAERALLQSCTTVTRIITDGSLLIGDLISETKYDVAIKCSPAILVFNLRRNESNSAQVKFSLITTDSRDVETRTAASNASVDNVCLDISGSKVGAIHYQEIVCND